MGRDNGRSQSKTPGFVEDIYSSVKSLIADHAADCVVEFLLHANPSLRGLFGRKVPVYKLSAGDGEPFLGLVASAPRGIEHVVGSVAV